jgi:hypothetical protein
MNHVLRTHIKAGYCYVYLDDILSMSFSVEEHATHLNAVLTALRQHNLFCQLPKCEFALSELRYLGHLVNGTGVKPDPKKVAAIDGWKPPLTEIAQLSDPTISNAHIATLHKTIAKRVRSFLGFMQYFNRFIPRFSETAAVLYDCTKAEPVPWTPRCTQAWRTLCTCLSRATLMRHPDFRKPFHMYFDASLSGIGGMLAQ